MVSLPYGTRGFAMAVIVPTGDNTPEGLLATLDGPAFADWLSHANAAMGFVGLPKLKFSFEASLNSVLRSLGMSIAFSNHADFSRMFVGGQLCIDSVFQKAFLQVDERGTEAAAVTAVTMRPTSIGPTDVDASRPFLFVIYEKESGAIMFMGKIAEPEWQS